MATTTYPHLRHRPELEAKTAHATSATLARARALLPLLGRVLFALLFLASVPVHFDDAGVAHAASRGVPAPEVLVPLSGVLLLLGGASVALGFYARIGALLLALFLVPVSFYMHPFWAVSDPARARIDHVMFMKNVALFGGALLIAYFGSGPASIDAAKDDRSPS